MVKSPVSVRKSPNETEAFATVGDQECGAAATVIEWPLTVTVPMIWTGLEFLRSFLGTGFAWYFLGHTQHHYLAVIQVAQQAGFTVAEIRVLLHGFGSDVTPSARWRALAAAKLPEVEALIRRAQAMKAVLEQNPKATPAEIEKGLQGNICRCGTYEQMRDAIYALCNRKRER